MRTAKAPNDLGWRSRPKQREYRLRWLGLPPPTRPEPLACELCGATADRLLDYDHCHLTDTFRGWLCHKCNKGIGLLGDSVEGLERALRYLTRHAECVRLLSEVINPVGRKAT